MRTWIAKGIMVILCIQLKSIVKNFGYFPRFVVPRFSKMCQKTVRKLSEICQFQKCVKKLSEMCQISVRNMSLSKMCQKSVTDKSKICQINIRIYKYVINMLVWYTEICQKSVKLTFSDTFLTHFRWLIGNILWNIGIRKLSEISQKSNFDRFMTHF